MNLWKRIVSCLDPRCFLYVGRLPWNSSKVPVPSSDVDDGIEKLSDRIKEANEQINAAAPLAVPSSTKKELSFPQIKKSILEEKDSNTNLMRLILR